MAGDFISKIKEEVDEIRSKHPDLNDSKAFIFWFIRGFLWPVSFEGIFDEDKIKRCIYCQKDELKVDAVFEDEKLNLIFMIQAKYRLKGEYEKKDDIRNFFNIAYFIVKANENEFESYIKDGSHQIREKLREVRNLIKNKNYRLVLQYVTTAKVERDVIEKWKKEDDEDVDFEIISRSDLNWMYQEYAEVGQPPVPLFNLPVEKSLISWEESKLEIGVDS
ncbi:MAG: hypothetical protein ACUVWP_07705 [bacterium]